MSFGHERLDVYRAAIEYVGWGVAEEPADYAKAGIDSDTEADSDPVGTQGGNAPVRDGAPRWRILTLGDANSSSLSR